MVAIIKHCVDDIVNVLNGVSSDESIQRDGSSKESNSDISDVQIILLRSKHRQ